MAKRKASCGNARRCSMSLTNVTRGASDEALPHHRLSPASSGLTNRFPLQNRCLWKEAISCQAAIYFGNALEEGKRGDAVGRPRWRSSFQGDPGAKFLCEIPTNEKLTKFREYLSQSRRHAPKGT